MVPQPAGMVVRQALADDPDLVADAKMTLVVDGQLTGRAIEELHGLKVVRGLRILK